MFYEKSYDCVLEEIDLHGLFEMQGLSAFVTLNNQYASMKKTGMIKVIHGYGSSGPGGVIRRSLRKYLDVNEIEYESGEYIDSNPGYTCVWVGGKLLESTSILNRDILKYCENPKNKNKIEGKFRRHGSPTINKTIKVLLKQEQLVEFYKGKVKVFQSAISDKVCSQEGGL